MTTLVFVLATDLQIGVAAGIVLKLVIHVSNGVPVRSLFKPYIEVQEIDDSTSRIVARESAVFSNWIPFRRQIEDIGMVQRRSLIVDVSDTRLVDHSVMEKLDEVARDFEQEGLTFRVEGLESLRPVSDDAHAARRQGAVSMKRLAIVVGNPLEAQLRKLFYDLGATGYTAIPCSGAGRRLLEEGEGRIENLVRLEVVCPNSVCDELIKALRREILPTHAATVCVEGVHVLQPEKFVCRTTGVEINGALN